jgi:hypothetical protein
VKRGHTFGRRAVSLVYYLESLKVKQHVSLQEAKEWRAVFWITLAVYIVGMVLFCAFMSADVQPWAGGALKEAVAQKQEVQLPEEEITPDEGKEDEEQPMVAKDIS